MSKTRTRPGVGCGVGGCGGGEGAEVLDTCMCSRVEEVECWSFSLGSRSERSCNRNESVGAVSHSVVGMVGVVGVVGVVRAAAALSEDDGGNNGGNNGGDDASVSARFHLDTLFFASASAVPLLYPNSSKYRAHSSIERGAFGAFGAFGSKVLLVCEAWVSIAVKCWFLSAKHIPSDLQWSPVSASHPLHFFTRTLGPPTHRTMI